MIYETLFAWDEGPVLHPQMAGLRTVSPEKLTCVITALVDGRPG